MQIGPNQPEYLFPYTFFFLCILNPLLFRKLRPTDFLIDTARSKQLFMIAVSHHLSVIQYQDLIGMHDRGCSLRYQKYGHIFRILGQCFSKCRICSEIKRRCTVIQNQDLWIFHQCSCDRQPLSLPSDRFFPPSLTGAFSLPGFSSTNSKACAVFNAAYISCSDACSFPI